MQTTIIQDLRAENRRLKQENRRLQAEVDRLTKPAQSSQPSDPAAAFLREWNTATLRPNGLMQQEERVGR